MLQRFIRSTRLHLPVLLVVMLVPAVVRAQPTPSSTRATGDELVMKKAEGAGKSPTLNQDLPPVERPVDPALYRLGPNDQLLLSVPMFEGGEYPIVVSVDNTILLPRGFPLLSVRSMSLARLRQVVDSMFRARSSAYRNVSVALLKPRSIYVSVAGDVLFPDRYILTAADRPTTAIDIANRVSMEGLTKAREEEIAAMRKRMHDDRLGANNMGGGSIATRWATIRHNDGSVQRVDLLRYRATGDETQNPTLREGDELIVHAAEAAGPTISVVGAVNQSVVMPYAAGDNALMAMRLAGGARNGATVQESFIARRTAAGVTKVAIDLDDTAALATMTLQQGDQLVVVASDPAVAGEGAVGIVSVVGEVQRPSAYPIVPGITKLSEVIAMAGGVRPEASLNGAYITRAIDRRYAQTRSALASEPGAYIATSRLFLDDTTRLKFDLENQKNRVSADFVEVIGHGNTSRDVPLENGDEIVVPSNPKNVFIRGRVRNPGWVTYRAGATYEDYVAVAGGYADAAVPSRAQVLKFGSGVWSDPGSASIMPGDEIYVPGERDLPGRTSLEIAGTIVGITGGIASLAFTIFTFVRELTRTN